MPIFPLPTSILFPGVYVPFHIFEDRYKAMIKKVLETDGDLAVSYAPEMQPGKFFPSMICGAGPVRVIKKFDSGESDILVFGTQRIKFHKYIQEIPYLIGEGEILPLEREMPQKTHDDLLSQIREMLINWIFSSFEDVARPIQFFKNLADLELLCNFITYYFIPDISKRQTLLEENSLESKAQAVWTLLKDMEMSGHKLSIQGGSLIFPGHHNGGHDTH